MSKISGIERTSWMLALLSMIIGIGALFHAITYAGETIDGLHKKEKRIHKLASIEIQADDLRGAAASLERDGSMRPASMQTLTDTYLENSGVKPIILSPVEVGYGWELQRAKVSFSHLSWESLSGFLKKVEEQRPPWRIKSMSLAPVDDAGLSGELELHALQKTEI